MSSNAWASGRFDYPHLRIPPLSQPEAEAYCVPYALWIVINYVANEYPDQNIQRNTKPIKTVELVDQLDPDPLLGWKPNQSDLTKVANMAKTLNISLEEWPGTPPKSLIELSEENLKNDLPLIAFIDSHFLLHGVRSGRGADHSVVICGLGTNANGENTAIVANPWFAALHEVKQAKLEEVWDPSRHQIIDIDIEPTSQPQSVQ